MRGIVLRYRVMAYITGVVLIVLCFVGIPLQIAGYPALVNVVGTVHGILYIIYLVTAAHLVWRLRLRPDKSLVVLLAGTIPILTFVVERWVSRTYITPALERTAVAASEQPVLR